ncbi:MAG: hypothetical protein RJQ21_01825 [Rhodospirillales bacterium]
MGASDGGEGMNRITAALISLAGGALISVLLVWFFELDYDAVLTGPVTVRAMVDSLASVLAFLGGAFTIWRVLTNPKAYED